LTAEERKALQNGDEEEYFHALRHLQEDYAGVMNVLVGAEFGYSENTDVQGRYALTYEKYQPDYVINSVHSVNGQDFAYVQPTGDKKTEYGRYLRLVRNSLDVPYHYDIVGHIGYVARYVSFENRDFDLDIFGEQLDDILKTIIAKGKILEVNSANKQLKNRTLPAEPIVARYYQLGGRNISFGSDSHFKERIGDKRDEVVEMLKRIGFTHITVPCKGEYIKVEL
jgi:histidinol-phosphatase (PHP family)